MSRGYYVPNVEWISKDKWNETKSIIRQYKDLKEEYRNIIEGEAVLQNGQPRGRKKSDPTAERAIKAERIKEKIDAIEQCIEVVEPEYRKGVMEYIINRRPYPMDAARQTYTTKVQRYIRAVAYRLHII